MTTGLYSARNSSCDKLYHTAVKCYLDTWSLCVMTVESSTAQGYWTLKMTNNTTVSHRKTTVLIVGAFEPDFGEILTTYMAISMWTP